MPFGRREGVGNAAASPPHYQHPHFSRETPVISTAGRNLIINYVIIKKIDLILHKNIAIFSSNLTKYKQK